MTDDTGVKDETAAAPDGATKAAEGGAPDQAQDHAPGHAPGHARGRLGDALPR